MNEDSLMSRVSLLMSPPVGQSAVLPDRPRGLSRVQARYSERPELSVSVGLDFGTSSTKVAWRVRGAASPEVHPFFFLPKDHEGAWMLPSVLAVDESGKLLWGHRAVEAERSGAARACLTNLKTVLAGKFCPRFHHEDDVLAFQRFQRALPPDCLAGPEHLAAVFIALVMCEVASRIASDSAIRSQLGNSEWPQFLFSIAMPIHHGREPEVREAFCRVWALAHALFRSYAERLAAANLLTVLKESLRLWPDALLEEGPSQRVFFRSETEALASSYFRSLGRKDGIHCLVDIGGGSTDVTLFELMNVKTANERRIVLSSINLPVGFSRLVWKIADAVPALLTEAEQLVRTPSLLSANERRLLNDHVKELYELSCFGWMKAYELRPGTDKWKSSPMVFLAGGGSRCYLVDELFCRSWIDYMGSPGGKFGPYHTQYLPPPDGGEYSVRSAEDAPYDRMAVAYGLSLLSFLPLSDGVKMPTVRPRVADNDLPFWHDG